MPCLLICPRRNSDRAPFAAMHADPKMHSRAQSNATIDC